MLDQIITGFKSHDRLISLIAPSGYIFAYNIVGLTPAISGVTYPDSWWQYYHENTYGLHDPTVHWGLSQVGQIRWSEIPKTSEFYVSDLSQEVLDGAATYGMKFGGTFTYVSDDDEPKRSFFGASREDRDFSDKEMDMLNETFMEMVTSLENRDILTQDERVILQFSAHGLTHKEIARQAKSTPSVVKKCLESCRVKVGGDNLIQTILIAQQMGIITAPGRLTW